MEDLLGVCMNQSYNPQAHPQARRVWNIIKAAQQRHRELNYSINHHSNSSQGQTTPPVPLRPPPKKNSKSFEN